MSYIAKTIHEVLTDYINRHTFLPAIQREFVWEPFAIEKLFDSIMSGYPISSFLFWKIREEKKNDWAAYEFVRDYDKENPHNKEANLSGVNQDIYFVLDGQQRLTSLYIGLKGSYRYFYYNWHKAKLYINLFRIPNNNDNPEELAYQFKFKENSNKDSRDNNPQYWYLVGDILNYNSATAARQNIRDILSKISVEESIKENAVILIEELHSRFFTERFINYYEEKSQEYDKVVEVFIRTNTGGIKLEYSDILLSTATAKWRNLNAREEIHSFTDDINSLGNGYSFGKDFVIKGCLYMTDNLPIQYKVSNFTRTNLEKIEDNWDSTKENIQKAVKLISKFGFNDKNLVAKLAVLPIALYLKKINKPNFITSSDFQDIKDQNNIQRWIVLALLKNAFGSATDNKLKNIQEIISELSVGSSFPYKQICEKLSLDTKLNPDEIDNLLLTNYSTRYSFLVLSLLYPNRDWKDGRFSEDHIFPKSEFTYSKLKKRGYTFEKIVEYQKYYNTIINLQLLNDIENKEKSAKPFDQWISTRDSNFKNRHTIPILALYDFNTFTAFINERKTLLKNILTTIAFEE